MMRILSFRTSNPLESIPGQPIPLSDPETQKALGKITSLATCEDGTLIALALIRRHIAVVETSFHAKIAQQEISEFHVHWIKS